jgi:sugar lactone lactonase YvrE
MSNFLARVASSARHVLAEGPVWVGDRSQLLWIDVEVGAVFIGRIEGGRIEQSQRIDVASTGAESKVGAVVPGPEGSLLVAGRGHLVVIAADGSRTDGPQIVADDGPSRLNDGGCDPAGRLLVGTYHFDERADQDLLCRIESDGRVTTIDTGLSISNGLAWSPDGAQFFSTDTAPGIIWVRDYDGVSGEFGPRRQHLRIESGYPDGICMDSRGHLWVAIWGEGEVRSYTTSGEPEHTVRVPVPHVSSVAFAGEALDRLVITTASRDLDAAGLAQHPDAGRLFLADVGVTGIPRYSWSGSWGPAAASTH